MLTKIIVLSWLKLRGARMLLSITVVLYINIVVWNMDRKTHQYGSPFAWLAKLRLA